MILAPKMPTILDIEDERWLAFVAAMTTASIFHHPAWVRVLARSYGYHAFVAAVCGADGNIKAGVPLIEVNTPLGQRRWIGLPFSDHCIPLYQEADSLAQLTEGLAWLAEKRGVGRIELRAAFPHTPFMHSYSMHVLHVLQLAPNANAVEDRIYPMHRRNINIAQKKGVRIVKGEDSADLRAFYYLHLQTRHRQGVPIQPMSFFERLGREVIEQGLGFVLLAYKDDACLAGAVFLHWQGTLTYKYGASSSEGLDLRPNNLLFWTAIRWGCENGYTLMDLGRTGLANTGLRKFKSRWGADEVPLTYSVIGEVASQPTRNRLASVMRSAIQHSPTWVCRAAGEMFYRYFP